MPGFTRAHTTLPAADMERAKRWYDEKLGMRPESESPGGAFYTVNGSIVFLYPTPNTQRGGHTQLGLVSQDIDSDVAALKERGVVFEEYDFPGLKTENSVANTGEVRSAWFKDSEGNMIGLVQLPPGVGPAG